MSCTLSQADIEFHLIKIKEAEQDLQESFASFAKFKKDVILAICDHMASLVRGGYLEIKEDQICSQVVKRLAELEILISPRWIYSIVPRQYKQTFRVENGSKISNFYQESSCINAAEISEDELKEMALSKMQEARDKRKIAEIALNQADDLVLKCEQLGITLDGVDIAEPFSQVEKEEKEEHENENENQNKIIKTPKLQQESQMYFAIKDLSRIFADLAEKIYGMPPLSEEDDKNYTHMIQAFTSYLIPYQDEKYSKSFLSWLKVQQDNINYGKHAAGSMNASITLNGEKRNLTREQVGDKKEEILKICCRILDVEYRQFKDKEALQILEKCTKLGKSNFIISTIDDWHKKYAEPRIASRKYDVHPKLSSLS